jgi:hypothetical protein
MNRKVEIEKMAVAFQRAAHKALHGTREERSGRFVLNARRDKPSDAQESSCSRGADDGEALEPPVK